MTVSYPDRPPASGRWPLITERPRLTFVGTGYLGATSAACFAAMGYDVLGVDSDHDKIAALSNGELPFHEPELGELLGAGLRSGKLRFTTSHQEAAEFGDVHFLCVGTPQRADGQAADLSHLRAAVTALAPHLHRRALVVGKSTVPVGTTPWVQRLIRRHAPAGSDIEVAWSPEFLQEGFAVQDVLRPRRIVFGVHDEWASAMLHESHQALLDLAATEGRELPVLVTDSATAELAKVAANAFLATKISFINAMAEVCEASGADVTALARAIGYDPRIGDRFLQAGIGFGGGCLTKDIRAVQSRARELGTGESLRFLHEVDLINQRRRQHVLNLAADVLERPAGPAGPDLSGVRVAVLGVAFKPRSDDIRDSPALAIVRLLARSGAIVTVYDPEAMNNAKREFSDVGYAASLSEAVLDAELTFVLTDWDEFRDADPSALSYLVAQKRVIDGRNCLNRTRWTDAGWTVHAVGRHPTAPVHPVG